MGGENYLIVLPPQVVFEWPHGILHYKTSLQSMKFWPNLRTRNSLLKWPKIVSTKNYLIICFLGFLAGLAQKVLCFPRNCQIGGSKTACFGAKKKLFNYLFFVPLLPSCNLRLCYGILAPCSPVLFHFLPTFRALLKPFQVWKGLAKVWIPNVELGWSWERESRQVWKGWKAWKGLKGVKGLKRFALPFPSPSLTSNIQTFSNLFKSDSKIFKPFQTLLEGRRRRGGPGDFGTAFESFSNLSNLLGFRKSPGPPPPGAPKKVWQGLKRIQTCWRDVERYATFERLGNFCLELEIVQITFQKNENCIIGKGQFDKKRESGSQRDIFWKFVRFETFETFETFTHVFESVRKFQVFSNEQTLSNHGNLKKTPSGI